MGLSVPDLGELCPWNVLMSLLLPHQKLRWKVLPSCHLLVVLLTVPPFSSPTPAFRVTRLNHLSPASLCSWCCCQDIFQDASLQAGSVLRCQPALGHLQCGPDSLLQFLASQSPCLGRSFPRSWWAYEVVPDGLPLGHSRSSLSCKV